MLIDSDLIRFCAEKTNEIAKEHDEAAGLKFGEGLPRSAEDLALVIQGRHGFPIYHRELKIVWTKAKYRSFYLPKGERGQIKECAIYYAQGMSRQQLRFYKSKELLQIHIWQENLATRDIVDLVHNMIVREAPAAVDLNLGHSTTSDTLGEVAAMEFLFPLERRLPYLKPGALRQDGIKKLAAEYDIPDFIVQRALIMAPSLKPYFCPDPPNGKTK
jgi:hypothetical protein